MQKVIGLLTASLFLLGQGQAQSWTRSLMGQYKFDFTGCSRIDAATVSCTMNVTYLDQGRSELLLSFGNYKLVQANGTEVKPLWGTLAAGERTRWREYGNVKAYLYSNLPVKATMAFPYSGAVIPRLMMQEEVLSNVPVKGTNAQIPTPSAISGAVPKPPSTLAAPGYTVQLTDCRSLAGGGYSCSATLTPK